MKRFPLDSLLCFLCLIIVIGFVGGSSWADRSTFDATKGALALPMTTPPTIDGYLDLETPELWDYVGGGKGSGSSNWYVHYDEDFEDFIQGGVVGSTDSPYYAGDCDFYIWAGYDANYLYVAVQVLDDDPWTSNCEAGSANGSTWLDDSVEIFVDGDNSNFATLDTTGTNAEVVGTGGQYVITANNAYREAEAGNPGFGEDKAWFAKTDWTDTGYVAEFRISMSTIGNPQAGEIIGFSVAVNDCDTDGTRQVIWCGTAHTEATYGNLYLGPKSYTAPKVTTSPTIDGVINASEYANASTISVDNHTGYYDLGCGDDTWEDGDNAFEAWVVHDENAIYVAVDVTDDAIVTDTASEGSEDGSTWEDDAVEIFFDANNDKNTTYTNSSLTDHPAFEGQYVITPNNAWRDNEAGNPLYGESDDWYALTAQTGTGYQAEFKITKSALLDPVDGTVMGFSIGLDDDDGSGRKLQLLWQGQAHYEPSYGSLTLSSEGTAVPEWSLF